MAEFIPGSGQQEQLKPQPAQFVSPQQMSGGVNNAMQAEQATPAPPPSTPVGAGLGATQENPLEAPDEDASEEEQEQYQDLFIRTIAAVNDTRKQPKTKKSLADEVIKMLSTKDKEAYISVGTTAGLIMTQMITNAKHQGVEYEGRVIQEVGLDLIAELIGIARMSGAIKNLPEPDSEEEGKLAELAALEAAKFYGEYQIQTGQADQMGHRRELDEQMQREADSGALDDWGLQEMDPQMRESLAQQVRKSQGGV